MGLWLGLAGVALAFGPVFTTTVFAPKEEGCVRHRTPSLLRTRSGLLAFTQCRQVNGGDDSPQSLYVKHSADNGRTWGGARVLPFAKDPEHRFLHRAQTLYDW